ncbi:C-C motif chemokine 4-like isoform X6 [Gadus macrocephalus]|uniref:C-C motif chemokine 4-like isoform X6 n=1 Tax=Gadus macrocephalus TaxID=80720 RepID=UPI0028CB6C36|nr:C-C motif chemokine 4-like isoform X6 [Gadus macrocephalus]
MTTCGTVTKSLLLLAVVVALTGHGSAADWKVSECCTKVTRKQITETIVDYMVQKRNNHCVNAIIFKTESGRLYCCKHNEPWVKGKVRQLRLNKRAALASTPFLLKLITSSSSPPPLERTTSTPSTHYTVQ